MHKDKIAKIPALTAGKKYQSLEKLKTDLKKLGSAVLAYSGGTDSSFLLKVALDVLGKKNVLAVIARSQTYPYLEYRQAREFARQIGANCCIIHTDEFKDNKFINNPKNRCYYCKTELFKKLTALACRRGLNFVIDGSNYDDRLDYRPGSKAAKELGIISPLKEARLTKNDIRILSKRLRLNTWNKPAQACLASRIPYHVKISPDKLRMVEEAESFLIKLKFSQVRVRYYIDTARIEINRKEIFKILSTRIRDKIAKRLKKIGFKYITLDLEGYRRGSLNI